jgi:hypothetical protein
LQRDQDALPILLHYDLKEEKKSSKMMKSEQIQSILIEKRCKFQNIIKPANVPIQSPVLASRSIAVRS